jgi:hypothetical protein
MTSNYARAATVLPTISLDNLLITFYGDKREIATERSGDLKQRQIYCSVVDIEIFVILEMKLASF